MNKSPVGLLMLTGVIVAQKSKVYLDTCPIWMSYESEGVSCDLNKKENGYECKTVL